MSLRGYIIKRGVQLVPTFFFIILLNFVLVRLVPGDPAVAIAGEEAPPEYIEGLRERLGLNKPLPEQLIIYLKNIFQGDFGYSFRYRRPVLDIFIERSFPTLILIIPAILLSTVLGTILGTFSAKVYPSKTDSLLSIIFLLLFSMPVFWLGLLLMLLFALRLGWFPTSGFILGGKGIVYVFGLIYHITLPLLTLTLFYLPQYQRIARASVIEIINEDFITTARAIGLDEYKVFFKHALRNALLPILTMTGLMLGLALSGSVIVETLFGWPGIGRILVESVWTRDYPLLQGIFILTALGVTVTSLVIDILYAYIDPRVTYK